MKNTKTCDRKGLHHDLGIFQARCFVLFFISSTTMQPVTCNELSLGSDFFFLQSECKLALISYSEIFCFLL